jgi:RNA polymerase sigma-70 factor, ECF subfamily
VVMRGEGQQELAGGLRRRDHDMFSATYAANVPALQGLCWKFGAGDWAEDAAQESLARLWERPDRFDPGRGSIRTYLSHQAKGRAIDSARSDTARRQREYNAVAERDRSAGGVEDTALRSLEVASVRAALDQLPATELIPIVMAFYGELSYSEVARRLGISEGTIKSRIRRGLRRLAEELLTEPPS